MRLTMVGVLVPACSRVAPSLAVLVVARALTGGLFAAVIRLAGVHRGHGAHLGPPEGSGRPAGDERDGDALATALAGLAAYLDLWRLCLRGAGRARGDPGLFLARHLQEPEVAGERAGPLVSLGKLARRPWALLVVLLALVEGGVILGFFTYLAPAVEAEGYSAAASGLAVGVYGVATLGWTQVLKKVAIW
jgi:hypothetical protein